MMTPRSFMLAQRERESHHQRPPSPCTTGASHHNTLSIPTPSLSPAFTPIPTRLFSSSPSPLSSSVLIDTSSPHHQISTPINSVHYPYQPSPTYNTKLATSTTATSKSTTFSLPRWSPKYDDSSKHTTVTISSAQPDSNATMVKRKDWRETSSLAPSSPPKTTVSLTMRPTTPTSPVKIPTTNNRYGAHPQKRHSSQRKRSSDSRSSDKLSPSLVALLAVTDIPRHKQLQRRRRRSEKTLTVQEVIDCQHASEKELSWTFGSPLDMLLSPPQEVADDDDSVSDCNIGSSMSTRTYSIDSIPSLDESFSSECLSSLGSPRTPSPCSRRTNLTPMRKSLEPVISPPGSVDEHPLAGDDLDVDELDFSTLNQPEEAQPKSQFLEPFKPLRSVFKSNLTASLRALRSAARSFSVLNLPSIPPDDYLTRSILTIDPNVPYADERRPPVSEEMPSAAVRRYLNPTTNARIEPPTKTVFAGTFAASIQMRTYKIQRSRTAPGSTRNSYPSTSLQSQPAPVPQQPQPQVPTQSVPGMRQREMRENSDFIRIAVMEMAMRKRGKLDDQRPGRARFALPPRQTSTKPYEMGANGVPARWIPITV
ncbi:hypothetical protein FOQG_06116 [Fusarium oxysporum f. sp. raphani 54005]|uniref:Uncharacterized protein n=5 Tax=Fusarium oxysporum TaxID=5507 RepID=X0CDI3_FUSOX|nr:hypothetical protein FOVG_06717 [Fusarium oxysporum f. sp. pisi HDV247]EXK92231.1 hypothetical protein FOQG_06116 [Fusarium oxysporum f. sp. raphani 54005]KAJ4035547.1 hypothetical protein NW753_012056 [Fusarium oxysporum]EXA45851.1 hypothetical protein FOVG_06717 [Fusarium oxysporum f. sp. pisi HDV247]EXK92232.1 hypothetical protein FOQG_06116 [Fusarium oxysporum f. sp. raphani 54005]